ncbi:DNAJC2 [Cordylochernes scorpioides]|uniref:DnaJ homolog subfamily C member 2 n=1 Tax=Cordylochernes scorpioides TaxID=51811 RepID=A0ABY6LM74_9ARAC|nr:DNAJC2 [Cordylochernes scorpioides]
MRRPLKAWHTSRAWTPRNGRDKQKKRVSSLLMVSAGDEQRGINVILMCADRRKVLWHHPDKRKNRGENIVDEDHDYFVCITKAYEILSNPVKRKSYDSVDPHFDDAIPSLNSTSKANFFKVFTPVFARNSRYHFDSWREFSYKDEEEKDKADNRDERRWIEKQNKIARQKLKKEEMSRIRQLVDNAYACDPRIQAFKEAEKQKKLSQKKARQEAAKAKQEQELRLKREAEEAEKLAKQKEEEEARIEKDRLKREKEIQKKNLKKARKVLQQLCEENGFFAQSETEKISHMAEVDRLCYQLSLVKLQSLNKVLENSSPNNARDTFLKEVTCCVQIKTIGEQLCRENQNLNTGSKTAPAKDSSGGQKEQESWSPADIQLLIKAVNLFPAGTANRWQVVSEFMNQHGSSRPRQAKEVLAKTKELQKLAGCVADTNLKDEVNQRAFESLEKSQKNNNMMQRALKDDSAPSERFDAPQPWSAEEQKLLEQALKTFPSSTTDRWDRIADCIPNRTKKDCMVRYKVII